MCTLNNPLEQMRNVQRALEQVARPRGPLADAMAMEDALADFGRRLRRHPALEGVPVAATLNRPIESYTAAIGASLAAMTEPVAVAGMAASLKVEKALDAASCKPLTVLDAYRNWPKW